MPKPKDDKRILSLLVETKLSGSLIDYERIPLGYAGYVYKAEVDIKGKSEILAIKFSDAYTNPSEEERINDRVYGTSYEDYKSVPETYDTVVKTGLPIFRLLSFGLPAKDIPYIHQIMSWLDGNSVQEFLAYSYHERADELHSLAGEILSRLHQIAREYDGTVNQKEPFPTNWADAFFISFDYRLQATLKFGNEFMNKNKTRIKEFITRSKDKWENPKELVLSHTDGFQGMAKFENNRWLFTGIVDIEDHKFTDPRFALAGYELQTTYGGREVPQTFWDAYQKNKAVDPSYHSLRDLFQLYYLLSWFDIPYTTAWRGKEQDKEGVIKKNEKLTAKICGL